MRKPILGIIGICLLQVAFVAYNAYELPVDLSAVMPIREIAPGPADLDPAQTDIVIFRSGKPVSEAPRKPTRSASAVTASKREKGPFAKSDPIRPRVIFATQRMPRRTEYPVAPLEYREPQNAVAASIVTRQAKKKSFFSKALPIIKKPYDWAKAFAGKLK